MGACLVVVTCFWVLVDALVIGIKALQKPPGIHKGFLVHGPAGFFIACVLFWVVGFPAYLVRRRRHLATFAPRQMGGDGTNVNCPHCSTTLSVSVDLYGRTLVCPSCQNEFSAPRPKCVGWYYGQGPTFVGWVVYPLILVSCAIQLTRGGGLEMLSRLAENPRGAITIAATEARVRHAVQERLDSHPLTDKKKVIRVTLARESEGKYKGTLVTETDGRTEDTDLVVTVEDGQMRWQLLPKHSPEARALEWNRQEHDIRKNGNLAVAVQILLRNPDCKTAAESPAPSTVTSKLPEFYGRLIKLSGRVYAVKTYSADGDQGKAFGGKECLEVILVCPDKTVVDMFCSVPNPNVKVGGSVTVYGYPAGTLEVRTATGGAVTQLVLVGSACE